MQCMQDSYHRAERIGLGANSSEAADRLLLHRNSIPYRLERVMALTGLDYRDYRARLAIQLGLLAIDKEEPDETEHP
jgi:sugar diacid utilization regulator